MSTELVTHYSSPEEIVVELSRMLWVNELVERICSPEERDQISDPRKVSEIAPLVYEIGNRTKIWVIAVLAENVVNISATRSSWKDLESICAKLWIEKSILSQIQLKEAA